METSNLSLEKYSKKKEEKEEPVREEREEYIGEPRRIVDFLDEIGLEIRPPIVILLYGPPKAGKSVLALQLAKELEKPTTVFYAEPNYKNRDFQQLIRKYAPSNAEFREIDKPWYIFYIDKMIKKEDAVVIVDSASALGEMIADELKTFEPLVYTSRTALASRRLSYKLQRVASIKNLVVIIIAQATGTPQKYKGVTYKPSMTMKAMHYTDYDLLLEPIDVTRRRLTIVNARPRPWLEGKKIILAYTVKGIIPEGEEIEERKK